MGFRKDIYNFFFEQDDTENELYPKKEPKKQSIKNPSQPPKFSDPESFYIPPPKLSEKNENETKSTIRIPHDMRLTEGEIPIWFGKKSWASTFLLFFIGLICLLTVFLFFITIMCVIVAWAGVVSSEYFISNKRIYSKSGLLYRKSNEVKIEWGTNILFQQGFIGRILNFGNIAIATPGQSGGIVLNGAPVEFLGISDPQKVKAIMQDTIEKYTKKSNVI